MQKFCTKCGTPLSADMLVCPRCGKVAAQRRQVRQPSTTSPQIRQPARQTRQQYAAPPPRRTRTEQPQRIARPTRQQQRTASAPQPTAKRRRSPEKKNRIARRVFGLLTAAVVIAAVYIVIFSVQVFRVKMTSYPFETSMKLGSSNYGQAISAYFDEGKWSVNPLNGRCVYRGRSRHDEEYEIVFSAWLSVELEEIVIDGEEIDKKLYEQKIMAIFM